ncbi:MAG: transcription-repair coupling factor [Acidaminococcaceae bacterium]|jgi:transcription-repair coupling factor (superfamily II helicase)|nr:transcription-repair coupling factor [Acidaminococcaceae bacterium]
MKDYLLKLVGQVQEAKQAAAAFLAGRGTVCSGLSGTAKATFIAALDGLVTVQGSLVFLVSGRDAMREYRQTLSYFYPDLPLQELYPTNLPRVQAESRNLEIRAGRAAALRLLRGEEKGIVFVTAEALLQKQARPQSVEAATLEVKAGQILDRQTFLQSLSALGYEHTDEVDTLGQFAVRGDIVDVFPLNAELPIRLEWLDNELDGLRSFDLDTKRSVRNLETVKITPLQTNEEEEIYDASVFDYVAATTRIILDEPLSFLEALTHVYAENQECRDELWQPEAVEAQLAAKPAWVVSALAHNHFTSFEQLAIPVRAMAPYNRNLNLLIGDLKGWLAEGLTPVLMLSSLIKARNVVESLRGQGIAVCLAEKEQLVQGKVNVCSGELFAGFRFWNETWLLLTENDIYGLQRHRRFHSKHKGVQLQYFTDIKEGDYVVHDIHGIGRYTGVENIVVDGLHRDYLLICYAGNDKLYVPVDQVGLLHKYVGNEGVAPKLSKMGGADWKKMKAKASTAITELAEELLRLYANRKIVKGHAFSKDTEWQKTFEEQFPFEETPDQVKAIEEIKADMEKPVPMDRLLCGDVGYGKTEVALRAAFKAVMDGKQVAVLVPTTVLAQQHYLTFKERMDSFGLRIAMLSRFCSPTEVKESLAALEMGQVDILIGTHRLLQEDVVFKDLGLLIIDEEQRFGVVQKEKIKKWKVGIDVLTLSATPIPRTLHMALVNGRDMSVIESPPEDRLPVETYVAEYDDGMIKEAIEREIRRGGRIYYVHNRVSGLGLIAARLHKLVPGLSIRVAHGQMNEDALEEAMLAFYQGQCDILLSTTIVENGLDVPLANTIIIDGAENFGLSQLYQMRGRVGRSSRLAYAYFVYRRNKVLSEVAAKRLQAIRDFTELGAGFKIAMRDLEIRGAGNLLGPQQHGYIAGIGFAAYCDILEKTINTLKNGQELRNQEPDPILEIPLNAYIPDSYISDPRYKLELYRRFVDLEYQDGSDLLDEIIDRFGTPPEEVELLWRQAKIRSLCRQLKIRGINVRPGLIQISFAKQANVRPEAFIKLLEQHKSSMKFKSGEEPRLIFRTTRMKVNPLEWLEKTLPGLL